MKEITLDQMRGKTVSGYVYGDNEIMLVFKEGVYTVIEAFRGYEDGIDIGQGEFDHTNFNDEMLIEAGVFTEKELEELTEAAKRDFELKSEKADRIQYARLKKKFEVNSK